MTRTIMYADLALNTKSSKRDDLFTYKIPEELEKDILVGQMVIVPLGPRKINGIVINIHDKKPGFETKDIEKIVDPIPLISEKQVELARFISEYYWAGFSQTLFAFLPVNLRKRKTKVFKEDESQKVPNSKFQITNKSQIPNSKFQKKENAQYSTPNISDLNLTVKQENALDKIINSLNSSDPKTFLLHGVTNSGKTEVYLRACAEALKMIGGCIFIVPEIALTPQSVARFEAVFGKKNVALVHSQLSISQKLKTWIDIKTGKKRIVVGSRSAIFAPVQDLRLIIVDEEHDMISFKSDQTPRYELHTVAEKLAKIQGATLVFGSATPLVTSYKRVIDGDWEYLSIPERIGGDPIFPKVKTVNMEEEKMAGNREFFSEYMLKALEQILRNKKQALLFLNRRGMASFIICNDCKKVSMCDSCDAALVFHSSDNKMWCHHCGKKYVPPTRCDVCGGLDFRFLGRGTERVEAEIRKYFPSAKIARMDRDTMSDDGAYQRIFDDFKAGDIDILIGTQMIVHGWDIPNVDLAGVVSIDESLLIPDYQSEESVFELLTQLAGRTGRGEQRGLMILQTNNPDNWIFKCVESGDYLSFAKRELMIRERFGYPPFGRLVKLSLGGDKKEVVEKKAEDVVGKLRDSIEHHGSTQEHGANSIEIIGPISPLIEKKYGRYWRNIILKFPIVETQNFVSLRDEMLSSVPKEWTIDVDPISLL